MQKQILISAGKTEEKNLAKVVSGCTEPVKLQINGQRY